MKVEYLPDGSPDCPLIRLRDFDVAEACRLNALFAALADGQVQEIALNDQLDVPEGDDYRLVLQVSAQDRGVLRVHGIDAFRWRLSQEGWTRVAALTDPFCHEAGVGQYQWLDETSGISVLLSPDGDW